MTCVGSSSFRACIFDPSMGRPVKSSFSPVKSSQPSPSTPSQAAVIKERKRATPPGIPPPRGESFPPPPGCGLPVCRCFSCCWRWVCCRWSSRIACRIRRISGILCTRTKKNWSARRTPSKNWLRRSNHYCKRPKVRPKDTWQKEPHVEVHFGWCDVDIFYTLGIGRGIVVYVKSSVAREI